MVLRLIFFGAALCAATQGWTAAQAFFQSNNPGDFTRLASTSPSITSIAFAGHIAAREGMISNKVLQLKYHSRHKRFLVDKAEYVQLVSTDGLQAGGRFSSKEYASLATLVDNGEYPAARQLLDSYLAKYPGESDLFFLKALTNIRASDNVHPVLENLAAAFAYNNFRFAARVDALVLKATILNRLQRYTEALDTLGAHFAGPDEPKIILARAKALLGLNRRPDMDALIEQSITRYPRDTTLPVFFLKTASPLPHSETETRIADLVFARIDGLAELDLEILPLAASFTINANAAKIFLRRYLARGGSSPEAAINALRLGFFDEERAATMVLDSGKPIAIATISKLLTWASKEEGRQAIFKALSAFTGTLARDDNVDEYPEAKLALVNGTVIKWSFDWDQDGVEDASADFGLGVVQSILFHNDTIFALFDYLDWPILNRAAYSDGKEIRMYSFPFGAPAEGIIDMQNLLGPWGGQLFVPSGKIPALPVENKIYNEAVLQETRVIRSNSAIRIWLEAGQIIAKHTYLVDSSAGVMEAPAVDTTNSDSANAAAFSGNRDLAQLANIPLQIPDNSQTVLREYFRNGSRVFLEADSDGDGVIDTSMSFSASSPEEASAIRIDTDGDGIVDYKGEGFDLKEWDYNNDGLTDHRQLGTNDGALVNFLSTRMDGRFDEIIVTRKGKIESFRRNGNTLPLSADSNAAVTWVGTKPFDLGPAAPNKPGVYGSGPSRYRMTVLDNVIYAEVVP